MATPISDILPPEVDAAFRAAVARDSPGREIAGIKVCAVSPYDYVVRVYIRAAVIPLPYGIYQIDLATMEVSSLHGDAAKPYVIPHYK